LFRLSFVRTDEIVRIFTFLSAVALTYAIAVDAFVRGLLARRRGQRRVLTRLERLAAVLALLGLPCIAYGFFEPYRLETTHVALACPHLPSLKRPLRIVHLSDLHCEPQPRLEERLPEAVAAEKPDLIVFTGDALNSAAALPLFRRTMTRLAAIAPTFAVRGNWDAWYWPHLDLFGGTGVTELDGVRTIDVAGARLTLIGGAVLHETELRRRLREASASGFRLLLYHYPDEIEAAREAGVDLYCAGHTHGGQIALPWYGALMTLSRYGKKYEAGLYREGETWLYVNRGIGMEGGPVAPRVRFCARPELTVIDLSGGLAPAVR
jgi:predicted MPP superfamily phosphohydrolase